MMLLSDFYEMIFGCKVYKIALDAGCTCPNRDGTKGFGGCIFCSARGSGDFILAHEKSISAQIAAGRVLVEKKLSGRSGARGGKYIAYFQNFTSTYGNAAELEKKYREALDVPGVCGIAIATRPDCLGDEILSVIERVSFGGTFTQVELGLQTANDGTGRAINRCFSTEEYRAAVVRLKAANPDIHIVTHILFGLPGEVEEDMMNTVRYVVECNSSVECGGKGRRKFGLKIAALYILSGTRAEQLYNAGQIVPIEKESYFSLLKKALALLPENAVLHRLSGDPPKQLLVAPAWTADKKRVLNGIKNILRGF